MDCYVKKNVILVIGLWRNTIYVQDKQGIKISKIDFFATTPYILEVKKIRHILDT